MALDDIIKEHTAWLEQAVRQPIFQKVGDADVSFPQDLRDRRAKEIGASIEALGRRRAEADRRFAAAIATYEEELKALKTPAARTPNDGPSSPPRPATPATGRTEAPAKQPSKKPK